MNGCKGSQNLPLDGRTRVTFQLGKPRLIVRNGLSRSVLHGGHVAEQLARPRDVFPPACDAGEIERRRCISGRFGWIALHQPILGIRGLETNRIHPAKPLVLGQQRFGCGEMLAGTIRFV